MGRKLVKKSASPKQPEQGALFAAPRAGSMERLHKEIEKALREREFTSMEEANAFLREKLVSGEFNHATDTPDTPKNPIEEAQELCWQAEEAPTLEAAARLFKQALALDPDCTDALLFKSRRAKTPGLAVEILEEAVLSAADRLGGLKYIRENTGHFWGLVETRPYMRAKAALAEAYMEVDRQLDAIAEYENILDLCPNDNMGIRYSLLGRYIRVGDLHRAWRLLKQYDYEESTAFLYGRLFVEILDEDFSKAKRTLTKAIAENRHVYDYLAGLREEMPEASGFYSPGDESEAAYCLECLHEAYLSNPVLLMWIVDQAKSRGERSAFPVQ
jgi:tetratricopeptide (TPR) repeat protein